MDTVIYNIKPQLESITGIDRIEVIGGVGPEFRVILLPQKLAQYHIGPAEVIDAIRRSNGVDFLGTMTEEYRLFLGFSNYQLNGLEDIQNILLSRTGSTPIYLKQVAQVLDTTTELVSITATNGHPAVLFNVIKHPDADVITVSRLVHKRLAEVEAHIPSDMHVSEWYDLAQFVKKSINGVAFDILIGIIIVVIITYLFLRNIRATIPIFLIMPLVVMISFIVMRFLGLTINIMTLGGLTAAIGILVDDAIVVVENIIRRIDIGEERESAVVKGSTEVITSLIGATLTTVSVFIPMILLSGVTGFFFRATAITISVALIISFILALLITPIIADLVLSRQRNTVIRPVEDRLMQRAYRSIVVFSLKHTRIVILFALLMAAGAGYLFVHMPTGFLPVWDEGTFVMDLDAKPGTSLEEMNRVVLGVEKVIASVPVIQTYSRQTGDEAVRPNQAHFFMHPGKTAGKKQLSVFQVMDELQSKLADAFPDLNVDLHQLLPDRFQNLIAQQNTMMVKLLGNSVDDIQAANLILTPALKKLPEITKITAKTSAVQPEFLISYRNERLARLNLMKADVSSQIATVLRGTKATEIMHGTSLVPIRVTYPSSYHRYVSTLKDMPIFTPDGKFFPLSTVGSISVESSAANVYHENGVPVLSLTIETKTGDLRSNAIAIQKALNETRLPQGVTVQLGGDWASQIRSFQELLFVLILAGILVFTLVLFEFRDLRLSLITLVATILSLSFVIFGLALTGTTFNVPAFMGLITALGLMVRNGILIIDFAQRFHREGLNLTDSIVKAGVIRIRPVMITSVTTIGGFMPLALSMGGGGEMLQPFAVSVVFGLLGSMFFSLLIIPNLYHFLEPDKTV
jgi:multidrug efflux pump subunit AcrB